MENWVQKLTINCVEEEDGSLNIEIEWDEKDPDLALWSSFTAEEQKEFMLTALKNACNNVLNQNDN
jgi:hypothetical protein